MNFFKKNWACDHLKTGNLSADNFKNYSPWMGRQLNPRYDQVILVSEYLVLTAWKRIVAFCLKETSSVWKKYSNDWNSNIRKPDIVFLILLTQTSRFWQQYPMNNQLYNQKFTGKILQNFLYLDLCFVCKHAVLLIKMVKFEESPAQRECSSTSQRVLNFISSPNSPNAASKYPLGYDIIFYF